MNEERMQYTMNLIYNDYIYSIITKKQAIKDLQSIGLNKKEAIKFLKKGRIDD